MALVLGFRVAPQGYKKNRVLTSSLLERAMALFFIVIAFRLS